MQTPIRSIIMPSYNHERYIGDAIESVLGQTEQDFEFVIVDDASRDRSREIITQYAAKDSRIRTIFHEQNQGIAAAHNDGFDAVHGTYISFISSDDLWERERLSTCVQTLIDHPDAACVYTNARVIDADGIETGQTFAERFPAPSRGTTIAKKLLWGNFICGSSATVRRSLTNDLRYHGELRYLNDWLYWLEVSERGPIVYETKPLVRYRIHEQNSWRGDRQQWLRDHAVLYAMLLERPMLPRQTRAGLNYLLGRTQERMGDRPAARHSYRQSLKFAPLSIHSFVRWLYVTLIP